MLILVRYFNYIFTYLSNQLGLEVKTLLFRDSSQKKFTEPARHCCTNKNKSMRIFIESTMNREKKDNFDEVVCVASYEYFGHFRPHLLVLHA